MRAVRGRYTPGTVMILLTDARVFSALRANSSALYQYVRLAGRPSVSTYSERTLVVITTTGSFRIHPRGRLGSIPGGVYDPSPGAFRIHPRGRLGSIPGFKVVRFAGSYISDRPQQRSPATACLCPTPMCIPRCILLKTTRQI